MILKQDLNHYLTFTNNLVNPEKISEEISSIYEELSILTKPYDSHSELWKKYNIEPKLLGTRVKELTQLLKRKLGKNYQYYFSDLVNKIDYFKNDDSGHYFNYRKNIEEP